MASRSLLRLLSRLPGAAGQDGVQAMRMLSTSTNEASSLLSAEGKKQEGSYKGAGLNPVLLQARQAQLSFASQLHTATREEEKKEQVPLANVSASVLPKGIMALPPQKNSAIARRSMGGAANATSAFAVHPYHVLPPSPWPLAAGNGAFLSCAGMALWFHQIPHGGALMTAGILSTAFTATAWWRDCIIESDMGMHTEVVKRNLISGVWLFIVSEAVLFFGLLWSCIHLGMAPNVTLQMQWPPVGVEAVGWDKRALVMSAVLAASYYSANVAVVAKDPKMVMAALGTTIALGAMFLGDQYVEYNELPFTITDSPYGSTFFITTGFHGMHVLLGTIWLMTSMAMYPRYNNVGVGMKGAVLYWHFVDIVWIAVYGIIYVAQL